VKKYFTIVIPFILILISSAQVFAQTQEIDYIVISPGVAVINISNRINFTAHVYDALDSLVTIADRADDEIEWSVEVISGLSKAMVNSPRHNPGQDISSPGR